MKLMVLRYFIFFVFLFWGGKSFSHQTYTIYSDSLGDIYLEADRNFILIHGNIAIPLYFRPQNGLLKLIKNKNSWHFNYLTENEWNELELTIGNALVSGINSNPTNSETWINFNEGFPAVILKKNNGLINISVAPLDIQYIHLDILGSVVAESDSDGNLNIKNNYKPFGSKG